MLLSTFNGGRYLAQQLDSLATQSHPRWTLFWRDDGSGDDSRRLVRDFAGRMPAGRCISRDDERHLGITGSFMALLRAVPPGMMAAFADQDDVWLPEKLERGVAALSSVPPGTPALYYARQTLVDAALAPIGLSPLGRSNGFPAALTQNIATGCTLMLNGAAVALVAATEPPEGSLHDWWSYLVVSAAGGRLIGDPTPVVLYRQHRGNAVGAPTSAIRRGVAALRRGPEQFMALFRRQAAALSARPDLLTPDAAHDLAVLQRALEGGIVARLRALRRVRRLSRQTWPETLLFRLWFLIG